MIRPAAFLLLCWSLGATAASAQDSMTPAPAAVGRPRALAIEAGRLFHEGEEIATQLGLRTSRLSPDGSFDFALAVFPATFGQGYGLGMMDFDLSAAYAVTPGVWLAPRLGMTIALGFSGSGAGAVAGYNVGGGLVVRVAPTAGLRLDYSYRRPVFNGDMFEGPTFSSVTVGFVLLR